MLITVDCGMTNMRLCLYDGKSPLYEIKRKAGGSLTALSGSSDKLKAELSGAIAELLSLAGKSEGGIEAILCSGILASDVGISYLPHASAPCGVCESARAARLLSLPEVSNIPLLLIPGVKIFDADGDMFSRIDNSDSMSGEECETYGIMSALGLSGDFAITLPGSYNKAIEVNADGRIVSFSTGMCGELIAAMSEHTMLKKTLPSPVLRRIIPEKLLLGFEYARERGMSPALIKTRAVNMMHGFSADEAANYFIGAVLADDIVSAAKKYKKGRPYVIGGSDPLRSVFKILLERCGVENIIEADGETSRRAPNYGAMAVYEEYKKIK